MPKHIYPTGPTSAGGGIGISGSKVLSPTSARSRRDMAAEQGRRADVHVHHLDIVLEAGVDELLIIADSDIIDQDVDRRKPWLPPQP
jgi:hypothetical protein